MIFRHVFGADGSFSYSEPLDFVQLGELLPALGYLTKESRERLDSFVLETVTLAELSLPDFEALLHRLKAQGELHRLDAAIGAYLSEHLAA